MRVCLL